MHMPMRRPVREMANEGQEAGRSSKDFAHKRSPWPEQHSFPPSMVGGKNFCMQSE